jgi:hypothetical protein
MPKLQPDITEDEFTQSSFGGGINTSVPANALKDDEVVDARNFELDQDDNLVVRQGVTGVGNGALWDQAIWDQDLWSSQSYPKRITSINYFQNDVGFVGILYTTGTSLYSRTINEVITDLTGALVLPDDVFWQWVNFNGIAIGVNKATSGSNPIKVSGPAPGTAALLGGTPPKAKYIEIWNSRVWVVDAANPNTVKSSKLGDPEDWTDNAGADRAVAIDIDKNDGDKITGLKSFKGRLFIFKSNSIYVLSSQVDSVAGTNNILTNTDPDYFQVDLFTKNIGCIAPYTIQPILDDVLFLSKSGVASLRAAQVVADFTSSLLSIKVKDIAGIAKNVEEISAHVVTEQTQYLLSIPANISPSGSDIVFVMDYRKINEGSVRWLIFDGYPAGTCYDSFIDSDGNQAHLVGCVDRTLDQYFIGFYIPKVAIRTYRDGGISYTKSILSKKFDFSKVSLRKLFKEWALAVSVKSDSVAITLKYFLNDSNQEAGTYTFNFQKEANSALWGSLIWGTDLWGATSGDLEAFIRRAFLRNSNGRKGRNIQFEVFNAQIDQGFAINNLSIVYSVLNRKHTSTA